MEIFHYLSPDGRDPFQDWLDGMRDLRCRVAVLRRIDRLANGNPGTNTTSRHEQEQDEAQAGFAQP